MVAFLRGGGGGGVLVGFLNSTQKRDSKGDFLINTVALSLIFEISLQFSGVEYNGLGGGGGRMG